ncbi:MAG: T9SS type A sorting domain-containing protein [Bacteroidales bacterium]
MLKSKYVIQFLMIVLFGLLILQKGNCQNQNVINVNQNLQILESQKLYNYLYNIYMFKDFDNKNNLWIGSVTLDSNYLNRIGLGFDTLETIKREYIGMMQFKLNNKIYGFKKFFRLNTSILDSLYLYIFDSLANLMGSKKIIDYTNNNYRFQSVHIDNTVSAIMLTENMNILTYQVDVTTNPDTAYIGMHIFDTLGNLINHNIIPVCTIKPAIFTKYSLVETNAGFKFLISVAREHIILYIDKTTLTPLSNERLLNVNDIINFYGAKKINDSIIVSYDVNNLAPQVRINIINYLNNTVNNIDFGEYIYTKVSPSLTNPEDFSDRFDFIREDSIYMCYDTKQLIYLGGGIYYTEAGYLTIVNFNLDGEINFSYKVEYDTMNWVCMMGMKVLEDNKLIVVGHMMESNWILKFSPNGFVGLTNIETNEKASLKVYPNPARDFINVDIEADRFSSSEIELFDIQGRLVKKSKLNAQIGNRIDVSNLNPGAYNYRVVINGKGISGKVIIGE